LHLTGYLEGGNAFVFSKGLGGQGFVFKNIELNRSNLYVRTLQTLIDAGCMQKIHDLAGTAPIYILGEIFGKGVQDLDYGHAKPSFRVFDIFVGEPSTGRFLSSEESVQLCKTLGLVGAGSVSRAVL